MSMYEYLIDTKEEISICGQNKTTDFYMTVSKPFEGCSRMIYGIRIVSSEWGKEKQEKKISMLSFSKELVSQLIRILIQE